MIHLKKVRSTVMPPAKIIEPTMVDINFNVKEVNIPNEEISYIDDETGEERVCIKEGFIGYEYETYRYESLVEYIAAMDNKIEQLEKLLGK